MLFCGKLPQQENSALLELILLKPIFLINEIHMQPNYSTLFEMCFCKHHFFFHYFGATYFVWATEAFGAAVILPGSVVYSRATQLYAQLYSHIKQPTEILTSKPRWFLYFLNLKFVRCFGQKPSGFTMHTMLIRSLRQYCM